MPTLIVSAAFCVLGLLLAGPVVASGESFRGEYQGTGRQCYGRLSVLHKTIAWDTPFAACKKTRYEVIRQEDGQSGQEAVLWLRGRPCGFGAIRLRQNPQHPESWDVTGYRSKHDFEIDSDDKLQCSVRKLPQ